MCETDFRDFSFLAIAGRIMKTAEPDVARVYGGLRDFSRNGHRKIS
ncbi:hypothetical protein Q7O_004121 [Pectobacterium carotovorum subsp. carotovorum PCCS1]|nr:hypothetical protein [Pectobacterium carotovorum subsp. carotovorum PCCS1]